MQVQFNKILGSLGSLLICMCLTACTQNSSNSVDPSPTSITPEVFAKVTNCDRDVIISERPTRILTVHPAMTEVLVAIGAKDQVLGQVWGQSMNVTDEFHDQVSAVNVISDDIPSQETILEMKPDLIVASGDFWFDGTRLPTLEFFSERNIPVFINSSACGALKDDTVENTWKDLSDLGVITGNKDKAEVFIDALKSRMDQTTSGDSPSKSAALVQVFQGEIYAHANGLYTDVLKRAGFSNVFDASFVGDSGFAKTNVETLLTKNPDYLIVVYPNPQTKQEDEDSARELLDKLDAVKNNKVVVVSENVFVGGVGTPTGVLELLKID